MLAVSCSWGDYQRVCGALPVNTVRTMDWRPLQLADGSVAEMEFAVMHVWSHETPEAQVLAGLRALDVWAHPVRALKPPERIPERNEAGEIERYVMTSWTLLPEPIDYQI